RLSCREALVAERAIAAEAAPTGVTACGERRPFPRHYRHHCVRHVARPLSRRPPSVISPSSVISTEGRNPASPSGRVRIRPANTRRLERGSITWGRIPDVPVFPAHTRRACICGEHSLFL